LNSGGILDSSVSNRGVGATEIGGIVGALSTPPDGTTGDAIRDEVRAAIDSWLSDREQAGRTVVPESARLAVSGPQHATVRFESDPRLR